MSLLNSGGASYYRYNHAFHVPHSLYLYTSTLVFLPLFRFLQHDISVRGYCHVNQCACFLFFVLNYRIWPICYNFSLLCTAWFHNTVIFSSSYTVCVCVCVCVYVPLVVISTPTALHIEQCKCAQTLSCLITYSFFTKMGHPEVRWSIISSCRWHNRHLLSISSLKFDIQRTVHRDIFL